jgi:hypothetical protein
MYKVYSWIETRGRILSAQLGKHATIAERRDTVFLTHPARGHYSERINTQARGTTGALSCGGSIMQNGIIV